MTSYWQSVSGANEFLDWYDGSPSSETDYQLHQFVKNIPFLGWYLDARDNSHKMNDYLSNRGLDYSDIRYNQAPYGRTYGSAQAQATSAVASLYGRSARSGGRSRRPRRAVFKSMNQGPRPAGGWSDRNPNKRYKGGHDRYHNNRMISHRKFDW